MLVDDKLPLPEPHCTFRWKYGEYKVNRPGIDGVDVYTARQMREYARAVEAAAYAKAAQACSPWWHGCKCAEHVRALAQAKEP